VRITSAAVASSQNRLLHRIRNVPKRAAHEWIRLRQRHLWKVIANGFARPILDRWGYFREDRTEGINYLRMLAGLPLLLKYRPDPVPAELWSPRRINELIRELRLRSYLEIGVFEGDTFENVKARRRYGVDPAPMFDVTLMPRRSRFAAMNSDDFFRSIRPSLRFDIVFIDGLHTFEQTYRDVINTLSHVRGGVIVIDDTVPSDRYSAIPDQDESYRARDEAGVEGRPWHGDVWRVVTLLDRHHRDLEWRTIVDQGNPQTLLWRRRREANEVAASIEEIAFVADFAYADVFANGVPAYFHPTTESLALAECIQSLRQ
jgi:hypothetical protein